MPGTDDSDSCQTHDEERLDPEGRLLPLNQSVGIQLAASVRLPAAAMPPESGTPESAASPVAAQAAKRIEEDFYRELALGVSSEDVGEVEAAGPGSSGGEATVVIEAGPLVDGVREDADQIYRAIYGKAAFNRQKMNAVLEAQLSAAGD